MKEIKVDANLVARCGLYCGACGAYLKGRCPGCHQNAKATWCKVRSCCQEHQYASCADCQQHDDPNDCGKFNNLISKFFALVFRSNRKACICQIRDVGIEEHARKMAAAKCQTIKR